MAVWDGVIPSEDLAIYERGGFGLPAQWDGSPCLLVVDALWGFIGRPEGTSAGLEEYPTACGEIAMTGLEGIRRALEVFRVHGFLVTYVCADPAMAAAFGPTTRTRKQLAAANLDHAYEIPDLIAPGAGEDVLKKSKASGFFRTPLDTYLWQHGIDTVVLAGCTTSGCIRATAVDAHSLGFETIVLEDAVWDRSPFSHAVSLFELSRKYAAVARIGEAERAWAHGAPRTA